MQDRGVDCKGGLGERWALLLMRVSRHVKRERDGSRVCCAHAV